MNPCYVSNIPERTFKQVEEGGSTTTRTGDGVVITVNLIDGVGHVAVLGADGGTDNYEVTEGGDPFESDDLTVMVANV